MKQYTYITLPSIKDYAPKPLPTQYVVKTFRRSVHRKTGFARYIKAVKLVVQFMRSPLP